MGSVLWSRLTSTHIRIPIGASTPILVSRMQFNFASRRIEDAGADDGPKRSLHATPGTSDIYQSAGQLRPEPQTLCKRECVTMARAWPNQPERRDINTMAVPTDPVPRHRYVPQTPRGDDPLLTATTFDAGNTLPKEYAQTSSAANPFIEVSLSLQSPSRLPTLLNTAPLPNGTKRGLMRQVGIVGSHCRTKLRCSSLKSMERSSRGGNFGKAPDTSCGTSSS